MDKPRTRQEANERMAEIQARWDVQQKICDALETEWGEAYKDFIAVLEAENERYEREAHAASSRPRG